MPVLGHFFCSADRADSVRQRMQNKVLQPERFEFLRLSLTSQGSNFFDETELRRVRLSA